MSHIPGKILALDLSSPVSSISLHVCEPAGSQLIGQKVLAERNSHSELLLSALQDLLGDNAWSLEQIDNFVTCQGPGSFTGLRIAYATLLGFVAVYPRPIYSISGAQARRCGYLTQLKQQVAVRVLTKIATGRFVESNFDSAGNLESESEQTQHSPIIDDRVVLTDGLVDTAELRIPKERAVLYPLKSTDLVTALAQSQSWTIHRPEDGYHSFTPSYFGSSKFD